MLYLRENKHIALHVACGDITDIALDNKTLTIKTNDDFLVSMLENGRTELENAIRWQGLDLELVIEKVETNAQKIDKDIEKLKRAFGDKLEIKE